MEEQMLTKFPNVLVHFLFENASVLGAAFPGRMVQNQVVVVVLK